MPDSQQAKPSSAGPRIPASGPFIGRHPELEALRAALDRAAAGSDQLVMLAGDAGMGKTRLCQEMAAEAAQRNIPVVWGRCFEEPGAPPYWPWIQAIHALVESCDDERLRAVLGDGAAHIAGIVPEVGCRLGDLPPVKPLEGDQARFQLFHAITLVWQRAARESALLLILDNLHWADPTSLRLLAFLAAELGQHRLLLLGTYRETELSRQHPLSETLAELTRYPAFRRLRLTGLSRDETEQFLMTACGAIPSAAAVATLHERTEGHPLFLVETVRYLLAEGRARTALDQAGALTGIPAGVREIIGKRLNRLSAPCARLLSVAACIGRAFSLELLPLVAESSEDAVLAALEEALAARVIEPLPRPDHYQFSHALIRETLYDEILGARRVKLHQRIGELLELRHRQYPEPYLAQLAYHYTASLPGGAADKALDYASRAAGRAAELLAYEEAVRFFQNALQLQQQHFSRDGKRRCRLLLGLGAAQNSVGASEPARETFREGAALARELGAAAALAQAALGFETASWRLGSGEQAAALLTEALTVAQAPKDARLRVELLAALSRAYAFSGRPAEATQAYRQAVALARRLDDPSALFKALVAYQAARFFGPEHLDERLAGAREALALAEQHRQEGWAVAELYGWYFGDLMEKGDLETAKTVVANHVQVAEAMRQPFLLAVALSSKTLLAIHEGRFPEAEALAQDTLKVGRRFSPANAAGAYGMQMFSIRREQGRLGEVLPVLRHFVATQAATAIWRPGLALLYAELDMREQAKSEFESLAADDFAAIPRSALWPTSMAFMAEVCAYLNDAARAVTLYRLMLPYAGRNIVTGNNAPCFGAADRLLGMLATTIDQRDAACRHFEAALAMNLRTGGRPWLARTQFAYAALLLRKRETGIERAVTLLEAALTTARELRMGELEHRCLALKDKLEDRLVYPDGLSKREVDVLRFLAAGHTNQEIGAQLFISPNTVANHIRSILAKTGTANRTEAAAYSIRKGLAGG